MEEIENILGVNNLCIADSVEFSEEDGKVAIDVFETYRALIKIKNSAAKLLLLRYFFYRRVYNLLM